MPTIRVAFFDAGVAAAIQEKAGPYLAANGITLQALTSASWSAFVANVTNPTTDMAVLPSGLYGQALDNSLVRSLDAEQNYFYSQGSRMVTAGNAPGALVLGTIGQYLTFSPIKIPDPIARELARALGWMHGGALPGVPAAPVPPNTFDFTIEPPTASKPGPNPGDPPQVSEGEVGKCTPQDFKVKTTGENSHPVHIIWTKTPPGPPSVERHALDNEGDAPKGKVASDSKISPENHNKKDIPTGVWNVPMCSMGVYTVTVTVIWECDIDGVQHTAGPKSIEVKLVP